eukprot:14819172-Alexandrium_andersonii.AAC.1
MPVSAAIRFNPQSATHKMHNRFRRSKLDSGTTSNLVPEAPEGYALRNFLRVIRICRRKRGFRGSEGAKSRKSDLQSAI